jgi:dihydrofolate reductase
MSEVIWHTMMSIDGFITGPDDAMDWVSEYSGPAPLADGVIERTGAILAGRRWYDVATERYGGRGGIYGGRWNGPVLVLTHRPPATPDEDPKISFVSDGVENAVAAAREAADGKGVGIFGANIAQQCLDAGLIDEIVLHVAPVLLGDGVRLYGGPGAARVRLERAEIGDGGQVTDLRFRVVR